MFFWKEFLKITLLGENYFGAQRGVFAKKISLEITDVI